MDERLDKARALERQASEFRQAGETHKAFSAYDEAGKLYSAIGEHLKASVCYAAAATCWNFHTGWQSLSQAATRNHLAAAEAMKVGHYEYARSLFREAALLYEEEGDSENYSECFISSQVAGCKRAWELWVCPKREGASQAMNLTTVSLDIRIRNFFSWIFHVLNDVIWGYGEKPFRTLGFLILVILGCGIFYSVSGDIVTETGQRSISFLEGMYMSATVFTTVGFGDFLPTHWTRLFAVGEALCGIIFVPLFLIGLTRRYLRMYR